MAEKLQLYQEAKIPELADLYDASYLFAKQVGDLDWVFPFPKEFLATYIANAELYGLNESPDQIDSSVRLFEKYGYEGSLFIGRLAVSRKLKGSNFTKDKLLPAIEYKAREQGKNDLRLTCLAHNTRLLQFYSSLGFTEASESEGTADAGHTVIVKEMFLNLDDIH